MRVHGCCFFKQSEQQPYARQHSSTQDVLDFLGVCLHPLGRGSQQSQTYWRSVSLGIWSEGTPGQEGSAPEQETVGVCIPEEEGQRADSTTICQVAYQSNANIVQSTQLTLNRVHVQKGLCVAKELVVGLRSSRSWAFMQRLR